MKTFIAVLVLVMVLCAGVVQAQDVASTALLPASKVCQKVPSGLRCVIGDFVVMYDQNIDRLTTISAERFIIQDKQGITINSH